MATTYQTTFSKSFSSIKIVVSQFKFNWIFFREVQLTTRSTPRAQTSCTHSLKSVKQCTQAWNIIAYCFVCPYPGNFMNVHPSGIPWCCQQTRTQKIEIETLCPRGWSDHPQKFQIVPCVIANISRKFHENAIGLSHRCGRPQAACSEPVGSYDKTTRAAICFWT